MEKIQNENSIDRLIRLIISAVAIMAAYFWLSGAWQIVAYVVGVVMLATSAMGFCGLYKLIGVDTKKMFPAKHKIINYSLLALLIIILVGGSYASMFFTKKIFIEDFSVMNNVYKQTLYNTGQNNRNESIANYEKLLVALPEFQAKYQNYKPYAIKSDSKFNDDIAGVVLSVQGAKDEIYSGDLLALHIKFEGIKNVFQDILKRNNFSLLSIAMLDFHDVMEVAVEAGTAKDAAAIIAAYPAANEKLQAVEAMANDDEIQTVRTNLEALLSAAKDNKIEVLPKLGADLKSSFVKTYLKRG